MLLDVFIAPSYIKFGHNGGIQHPLLKIIKKHFFFKRYTQSDLKALSSAFHNFGPKGLFDTGIVVPDCHSPK